MVRGLLDLHPGHGGRVCRGPRAVALPHPAAALAVAAGTDVGAAADLVGPGDDEVVVDLLPHLGLPVGPVAAAAEVEDGEEHDDADGDHHAEDDVPADAAWKRNNRC